MNEYKEFLNKLNEASGNNMAKYAKKILTVKWAKDQKVKEKFDRVMTNAGDKSGLAPEMTPVDMIAGKPSIVSKKGMENFRTKLKSVYSLDVGVNIAEQTVDYLTDEQVLKIINNIRKAMGLGSKVLG